MPTSLTFSGWNWLWPAVAIFAVSQVEKVQPVLAPPKMPELFATAVSECPRASTLDVGQYFCRITTGE